MRISDIHERSIPCAPPNVWALIQDLGTSEDRVWPDGSWPRLSVDPTRDGAPRLAPGTTARHGIVRHRCLGVEPGRSIDLSFACAGISGRHRFLVLSEGAATRLRHELDAEVRLLQALLWHLLIRPAHARVVEDLFDNIAGAASGDGRRAAARTVAIRRMSRLMDRAGERMGDRDGNRGGGRGRAGSGDRTSGPAEGRRGRGRSGRAVSMVAAGGLAAAGALHAYWACGGTWPGTDATDLARKVIGSTDRMPPPAASWGVAGLLAAASGLALAAPHTDNRVVVTGNRLVAGVLGLRAVAGFTTSMAAWISAPVASPFARRDLRVYSPLCTALGLLVASGARNRKVA